jgi:hypothetical protein
MGALSTSVGCREGGGAGPEAQRYLPEATGGLPARMVSGSWGSSLLVGSRVVSCRDQARVESGGMWLWGRWWSAVRVRAVVGCGRLAPNPHSSRAFCGVWLAYFAGWVTRWLSFSLIWRLRRASTSRTHPTTCPLSRTGGTRELPDLSGNTGGGAFLLPVREPPVFPGASSVPGV